MTGSESSSQKPMADKGGCAIFGRHARSGWIVLAISALALAWRLIGLRGIEIWRDEAITIIHTRAPWSDLVWRLWRVEDSPPLGFLLFKAWSTVSTHEVWLRLLPVIFGVLAVLVLMQTADRIQRGAGVYTGLLAAVHPVAVYYSQELRAYSLLFLFTALSVWASERAATDRRGRFYVLLVLFSVLAAWTHAIGLFLFPVGCIYLVVRAGIRCRPGVGTLVLWSILVFPMILFGVHWKDFYRQTGIWWLPWPDREQGTVLLGEVFGLAPIDTWVIRASLERMWIGFVVTRVAVAALLLLLARGMLLARTRSPMTALVAWLLSLAVLLVIAGWISVPNLMSRTLTPLGCPILLGLGLTAAAPGPARNVGAAAALLLFVIWGVECAVAPTTRSPSRAAFDSLRQRIWSEDLVFTDPPWLEDLSVYRLGDLVSGEHFLTRFSPVYAGLPARHQMVARVPDDRWAERLRARIAEQVRRGRVWVITYVATESDVQRELLRLGYKPVSGDRFNQIRGVLVILYERASQPAPGTMPDAAD